MLQLVAACRVYGGNTIRLDPNATTAVMGNLEPVNAVAQRGLHAPGVTLSGENPGGINILRSPKWVEIRDKYKPLEAVDKQRYWRTVTDEFWEKANKPWLEETVARGDKIRFVSDPNDEDAIYAKDPDTGGPIFHNGQRQKSIFGREVDYLRSKGYTFEQDGTAVKAT